MKGRMAIMKVIESVQKEKEEAASGKKKKKAAL